MSVAGAARWSAIKKDFYFILGKQTFSAVFSFIVPSDWLMLLTLTALSVLNQYLLKVFQQIANISTSNMIHDS